MNLFQRRNIAIALIIIGLIALGFGLWLLIGMFFPNVTGNEPNLPQAGNNLTITPGNKPEPRTIAAPVLVQGTSTPDSKPIQSSDMREAVNQASDAVARMGSGSSQTGFLGYEDVMLVSTERFSQFAKSEQSRIRTEHPATGPAYGVTTRVVSSKLVEGSEGSAKAVVELQAQRTEDAGDRGKPTAVNYYKYTVTLVRQTSGAYFIDEVVAIAIKP